MTRRQAVRWARAVGGALAVVIWLAACGPDGAGGAAAGDEGDGAAGAADAAPDTAPTDTGPLDGGQRDGAADGARDAVAGRDATAGDALPDGGPERDTDAAGLVDGAPPGDAAAPDADAAAPDAGPEDAGPEDAGGRPDVLPRQAHGTACTSSYQCEGLFCVTADVDPAFVDGYCTGFCDDTDPQSCGPDAACFDMDVFLPLCAKRCDTDADCRAPHYRCAGTCLPAAFLADLELPGRLTGEEAGIAAVVAAVDRERLLRRVRVLAGSEPFESGAGPATIASRDIHHPHHALAEGWLEAELEALGLAVEREEFWAEGLPLANLVADVPGLEPALPPVLMVAHFDSTGASTPGWDAATDVAPGASDNASGVAVALEIATVLTAPGAPRLRRTVRILLVDGEEYGLYGSRHHVALLDQVGEVTDCALNVDMVGATTDAMGGRFWYAFQDVSAGVSVPRAALGAEALALFVPGARPVFTRMESWSDNMAFWERGRCAVGLIAWPRRPSNHTVLDLPEEFQPQVFHDAARAAAAVVVAWAEHAP